MRGRRHESVSRVMAGCLPARSIVRVEDNFQCHVSYRHRESRVWLCAGPRETIHGLSGVVGSAVASESQVDQS